MCTLSALRASLIALLAMAGAALVSAAYADSGSISFNVVKAGIVIGGSGGSGTLVFHGRQYPIAIRGRRAGRAGDRAHQPEGRGADTERHFGRRDRQRGSQRPGDHGEVGELSGIEHREIRDMQRSLPRISFHSVRFCCSLCLTFIGGTID